MSDYKSDYELWQRTLPDAPHEVLHKKALAHADWRKQAAEIREQERNKVQTVIHKHEHSHKIPGLILLSAILLILALCVVVPQAHCQFSHINTVQTKSGGTDIGFHASPFVINCSTNTACTDDGTTLNITASSTAATAFSALTASTNSNAGTFAVSGNTWDFTAAGLLKLRIAAGLTTASNGEIGYDTTAKNWHIWGNAADNFLAIVPVSTSITNGHLATWSLSGGVLTLNDGGAVPSGTGTVTSVSAGNLSPLFTTSVATPTTTPALSFSLSNAAAHSFFGNNTGSTATPAFSAIGNADLPGSGAVTVNTSSPLGGGGSVALGGSLSLTCAGCLTSVTAHNLLSATHGDTVAHTPVLGDVIFGNATPAWTALAGQTSSTKKYLSQTGTGTVSAAPAWAQVAFADLSGSATSGQLPGAVVYNNQANTYSAGLQDFSAVELKHKVAAGLTETTNGQIGYDSTSNNLHTSVSAADAVIATVPTATPVDGDCVNWSKVSGKIQLGDAGAACGSGGGGGTTLQVGGSATNSTANLSNTTPAAPANTINAAFQKDASTTTNVSANVPVGAFDPTTSLLLYDEFADHQGSGVVGSLGWNMAGGGATFTSLNVAGMFGAFRVTTAATASAQAAIFLDPDQLGTFSIVVSNNFDQKLRFQLSSTSNVFMIVGLINNSGAGGFISQEIALEYDTAASDTNFMYVTGDGAFTRTSSGVAADTNIHTVRMRSVDNYAHVLFSMDGGAETSVATNLPTSAMSPSFGVQALAAASVSVTADYYYLLLTGLSR